MPLSDVCLRAASSACKFRSVIMRFSTFFLAAAILFFAPVSPAKTEIEVGQAIYERGILANGTLLSGIKANGTKVTGSEAACASCHRLSGFGTAEGGLFVPPIYKDFLFSNGGKSPIVVINPNHPMGVTLSHAPYDRSSLNQSLTHGTIPGGKTLGALMPRYQLSEKDFNALYAYLETLSARIDAGVDADVIHFASVTTPEVPETRRNLIQRETDAFVIEHNLNRLPVKRHRAVGFEGIPHQRRDWAIHHWELKGPPQTWAMQLEKLYQQQPVFAFVGGASQGHGEVIDQFCESHQVPCLLRNDPSSTPAPHHWVMRFSDGLSLEAALLSASLKRSDQQIHRVVQITDGSALASVAKRTLERQLQSHFTIKSLEAVQGVIPGESIKTIHLTQKDTVLCWCNKNTLKSLLDSPDLGQATVIASMLLLGDDRDLIPTPEGFSGAALRYLYPFELPGPRGRQLSSFYSWIRSNGFETDNEMAQSETYTGLVVVQEAMAQMLDHLHREYLLEKIESSLGMGYMFWGPYQRPSFTQDHRAAARTGYVVTLGDKGPEPVGTVLKVDVHGD